MRRRTIGRRGARARRALLGAGLAAGIVWSVACAPHRAGGGDGDARKGSVADGGAGAEQGPGPADGGAPDGGRARPDLRIVAGRITAMAQGRESFTVAAQDGATTFTVDRNTSVYLADRLGTLRDLVVGTPVRAQLGPGRLAYWIEVDAAHAGPAAPAPPSTAAGRPRLPPPPSGPAAEAPTPGDGGSPGGAVREVPAGPGSPEPNPGTTTPPGPTPEPAGPGTVTGGGRS